MRSRIRITWSQQLGWHIDLPTYVLVPGSFLPLIAGLIHADGVDPSADPQDPQLASLSAECEHPDNYAAGAGSEIDARLIGKIYRGHPRFGSPRWTAPQSANADDK